MTLQEQILTILFMFGMAFIANLIVETIYWPIDWKMVGLGTFAWGGLLSLLFIGKFMLAEREAKE